MKFFDRTRIAANILIVLCVLSGWGIILKLLNTDRSSFKIIVRDMPGIDIIILLFLIALFIFFLTLSIVLKCIIKDADDDLRSFLDITNKD